MRFYAIGAAALVLCASLAACAPTSVAVPSATTDGLADILAEARAYGSSDAQIAVLEHAVSVGEVTYDEYNGLLEDTFACFDDIGVSYTRLEDRELVPGFPIPDYEHTGIAGMPDEEMLALVGVCLFTYSEFVNMAYQTQPVVYEAQEAVARERLPLVIECLREQGVEIDDDASIDEAKQASFDKWEELDAAGIDSGEPCFFLIDP
jgi:hypothetical protein